MLILLGASAILRAIRPGFIYYWLKVWCQALIKSIHCWLKVRCQAWIGILYRLGLLAIVANPTLGSVLASTLVS